MAGLWNGADAAVSKYSYVAPVYLAHPLGLAVLRHATCVDAVYCASLMM